MRQVARAGMGLLVGTAAALLAGGSAGAAAAPDPPPQPCRERSCESPREGFRVTYEPQPDPIPFNRPFELTMAVGGAAKEGCRPELEVAATMPEHGHGMTLEPQVERGADGRFRVRGMLFHMPGRWWIEVAARCGEREDGVVFEVTLE